MEEAANYGKHARTEDTESEPPPPRSASPQIRYNFATDGRGPAEPKRVACTHCRQSKLRCDATTEPCSRCQRLNLVCSKDTSFKRVNKRSKIDELEAQVSQLRAVLGGPVTPTQLGTSAASPATHAAATSLAALPNQDFSFSTPNPNPVRLQYPELQANYRTPAMSDIQSPADPPLQSTAVIPHVYARPLATKVRAIECTAVGQSQIDELFQVFFQHYHPFLPILDPLKSPDDFYDTSPLLFWTIIFISCRKMDAPLSAALSKGVVHKLAWESISNPPLKLAGIQSLTLLCMWPSTLMHLWSDTSMAFSNMAITSAMHMGLHRPNHFMEYLNRSIKKRDFHHLDATISPEDDLIGRKTWAACNIVAQHMSANFGQPPMVSCFNWAADRSCDDVGQHPGLFEIRNHLIIQRFCYRATLAMTSNAADPIGLPRENEFGVIMNMLEDELNTLSSKLNGTLSNIESYLLLKARIYLQTFHWLCPTMTDAMKSGILRSYSTACAVIASFSSSSPSNSLLEYAPITFPRVTFNAAYIIFKILNSSFSRFIDFEAGASLYQAAKFALKRLSVVENDLAGRAANLLVDIWAHRDDDPEEKLREPVLNLTSHLTASLTYDAAFRWRRQCARFVGKPGETISPNISVPQIGDSTGKDDLVQQQFSDPNFSALIWDLFEDVNWNSNFDVSGMLGATS